MATVAGAGVITRTELAGSCTVDRQIQTAMRPGHPRFSERILSLCLSVQLALVPALCKDLGNVIGPLGPLAGDPWGPLGTTGTTGDHGGPYGTMLDL